MIVTNKEKYKIFCERNPQIPIFSQYWWMQAVAKDHWGVLLSERGNEILGSLVYYIDPGQIKKKIGKAPITQNNGVFIRYPNGMKQVTKLNYEEKVMNDLIDQLEQLEISYYEQNFHYNVTNWLPFYWRGYKQTTRYTYVLEDTSSMEQIYNNFSNGLKHNITKTKGTLLIKEEIDLDDFYTVNKMTFDRQQLTMPYKREELERIYLAVKEQNAGNMIGVYGSDETLYSVAYFIWDESSVYYLLGGANPLYRGSQAQSLYLYYGIELAHKLSKKFDFEGSMIKGVEAAVRKFGGIPKPYFRIWKSYEDRN